LFTQIINHKAINIKSFIGKSDALYNSWQDFLVSIPQIVNPYPVDKHMNRIVYRRPEGIRLNAQMMINFGNRVLVG